ncbi:hypothetical protein [Polyangium jinanense]|uniref:Lipoprotein n=1 Tax=Polyangium jinanense TaxID=2829994 RepID=A0A9X3WZI2_9BACT|nr:hypothetical protein [Polyangium jinanense]MDC3954624.1 hypothetical protein [Polyangium jinanense]MDC3980927.1 hypothetical protein [Polyangium jinanense]
MKPVALSLALLFLAGCGPSVVWLGHSPDRRHHIEVLESSGKQRVRVDGVDGAEYLGIGIESLVWSADGRRLAYPARREKGWSLVVDGRAGPSFDGLGEVVLSPDGAHVAYAAQRKGAWFVVLDETPGPAFDAILEGTLLFGRGGRFAYVARQGAFVRAIIDGTPGPRYDGIGALRFSEDGAAVAHAGRRGEEAFFWMNGRESAPAEAIAYHALAPRRGRFAYVAKRNGQWRVTVDGVESAPYARISEVLFSDDGAHVAYAGKRADGEVIVLDGVEGPPYEEIAPGSLVFGGEGGRLAYAARRGRDWHIVENGQEGPAYDAVDRPVFARRGAKFGYVAASRGTRFVVIDGREQRPFAWAGDLTFSADGRYHAYLADDGERMRVMHDGTATPFDSVIAGTLVHAEEGPGWACLVVDKAARKLFIVIDGAKKRPLDAEELAAAMTQPRLEARVARAEDAEILRRWVAAELALARPSPPR